MWETASLDCKDLQIYSNKVGNEEYKDVMIALYMLSELEDNDIGFTMCNGDIVSEEKYIGWINQILGTNYSLGKDLIYGKMWCGILRMKNVKRCI